MEKAKSMDRIKRNHPDWKNKFVLVPSNKYLRLMLIDTEKDGMFNLILNIDDLIANDWEMM